MTEPERGWWKVSFLDDQPDILVLAERWEVGITFVIFYGMPEGSSLAVAAQTVRFIRLLTNDEAALAMPEAAAHPDAASSAAHAIVAAIQDAL